MQANLDQAQIDYLKHVLGLESVLLPASAESFPDKTSEGRGVLALAKLMVLVPLKADEFPLHGQMDQLVEKMIRAMKLEPSETFLFTWLEHIDVSTELSKLIREFADRPILCMGARSSEAFSQHVSNDCDWFEFSGKRILASFSPRELLALPDLKRQAWLHLQSLMKEL